MSDFVEQQSLDLGDTPTKGKEKHKFKGKKKGKGKSAASDDSDFHALVSDAASESDGTTNDRMDVDDLQLLPAPGTSPFSQVPRPSHKPRRHHPDVSHRPLSPIQRQGPGPGDEFCGLCATYHAPGQCSMTESPENLAEYRLMLLQHAGDESIEERVR